MGQKVHPTGFRLAYQQIIHQSGMPAVKIFLII